jgi:dCTP deaminase
MILSHKEILKEMKKGKIKIEPFEPSSLKPCSYDLSLDNEFAFPIKKTVVLEENIDTKNYLSSKITNEVRLKPHEFILGITKEKITLPDNIAGFMSGRSRFARLGLQVHSSSNFVQPCCSNKQVFEIKNMGANTIVLKLGLKIGQIIFLKVKGKAEYDGTFRFQEKIL